MTLKRIANVPESHIQQPATVRGNWENRYNVACWLRPLAASAFDAKLYLQFRDQENRDKQVAVDRAAVSLGRPALLSSQIQLNAVGKITEMSVWIEVSEGAPAYAIDELFVQSVAGTAQQKQPKLISA